MAGAEFSGWREDLPGLLDQAGMDRDAAQRLAALLVAATEGAATVARAERSLAPFDLAAGAR